MVDINFFISELQRAKGIFDGFRPNVEKIADQIENWDSAQIRTAFAEIIPPMKEFFKILEELRSLMVQRIEQILGPDRVEPVQIKISPMYNWWHDYPSTFQDRIKDLNEQNKIQLTRMVKGFREAMNDELDINKVIDAAIKLKESLKPNEFAKLMR